MRIFVLTTLAVGLQIAGLHSFEAANAQEQQRYFPLHHHAPPGVPGQWSGAVLGANAVYQQPVKFTLPKGGEVTAYDIDGKAIPLKSGQARFQVGQLYRIKISGIEAAPELEVYPTFELLDRLHPPQGKIDEYPIPVEITMEDIEFAIEDRLVTRVVYLQQPQLAGPAGVGGIVKPETLPFHKNLIAEADERGRPMLIIRLGGRTPDASNRGALLRSRGTVQPTSSPARSKTAE